MIDYWLQKSYHLPLILPPMMTMFFNFEPNSGWSLCAKATFVKGARATKVTSPEQNNKTYLTKYYWYIPFLTKIIQKTMKLTTCPRMFSKFLCSETMRIFIKWTMNKYMEPTEDWHPDQYFQAGTDWYAEGTAEVNPSVERGNTNPDINRRSIPDLLYPYD